MKKGERIFIDDAQKDSRVDRSVDIRTGYVTKQIIVMPIWNNEGVVIGVFQALNKLTQAAHFSNSDFEKLELVAAYSGKRLRQQCSMKKLRKPREKLFF